MKRATRTFPKILTAPSPVKEAAKARGMRALRYDNGNVRLRTRTGFKDFTSDQAALAYLESYREP